MKEMDETNSYLCGDENKEKKKAMINEKYVMFDWAAKYLLRDKADFVVLEGLVSAIINEPVTVVELLESESNRTHAGDKCNRVDIKAKDSKGDIILVEIQQTKEVDYMQRVLYSASKAVTEHVAKGSPYLEVKKIYSISILYFDLGRGTDYLYHGQTTFTGVHTHDTLQISNRERRLIEMDTPDRLFPEYYLVRVNAFNKKPTTPLEEWLYYLKEGEIDWHTTTHGLKEAKERLLYVLMDRQDQIDYEHHLDDERVRWSDIYTARMEGLLDGREEGLAKGREEGLEKGRAEGLLKGREEGLEKGRTEGLMEGTQVGFSKTKAEIVRKMLAQGVDASLLDIVTNLKFDDIEDIRKS